MIVVQLNEPSFTYDIHSLVKAFYPPENVCVCTEKKELREEVSLWLLAEFQGGTLRLECKKPQGQEKRIRTQGHKVFYDYDFGSWTTVATDLADIQGKERREVKNVLKQSLYGLLSRLTGQSLPWGTLTGIRPTKFALDMLEAGDTEDEIRSFMEETFYASKEKIELSIQIAQREREILSRINYEQGFSLYIGIPFCPSTCLYCSFPSYALSQWSDRVDDYLAALEKEIDFCARRMQGYFLNTVYIGGGTPTTLTLGQLGRLVSYIKRAFGIKRMPKGGLDGQSDPSDLLEFTVEAGRPDSITREKLETLREEGVSRISINPQTMKQETLDYIGRHHRVEQVWECFSLARELGFDNINMDLIMGLPRETLEDVRHTMDCLGEMQPDNITVHSLAIKRAAGLGMYREDYEDVSMQNTQAHMDIAAGACARMGMTPYYLYRQKNMAGNFENTGYARRGKAGIYNILIMEEKQTILALGAGATTKLVVPQSDPDAEYPVQIKRFGNVKDVGTYIDKIDEMLERKESAFWLLKNRDKLL